MRIQIADDESFSYRVERSAKRRTVSIQIDAGEVVVRAPKYTDDLWISGWVKTKAQWIYPRLVRQRDSIREHQIEPESGEVRLYGEPFKLEYQHPVRAAQQKIDTAEKIIRINGPVEDSSKLQAQLKKTLRLAAKPRLVELTGHLAEKTGLYPSNVHVRDYKRKWGQCSSTKEITLNWRLLHLPTTLQSYVIVHELCHLQEMNHSVHFWRLVEHHCPDFRPLREELKRCGAYLIW